MQTQTDTKTAFSSSLMSLPMMKHYDQGEIATKVENFRKGEKGLFWFFKLALLVGLGYLTWVYVLPPLFQAIGQFLAVAATGILIIASIIMAPVILKGIRLFTRAVHKALIKYDPFAQLEIEKQKMLANQQTFRIAKQNIVSLKSEMELEATKSQEEAESGQKKIISLQSKASKIKAEMERMEATLGPVKAKAEDAWVEHSANFNKTLAEAQRITNKLEQSKDFVQKYGTRANIMKKMGQKLTLVETAMEIKIADFDATIEMLKKDYEFGQKSNQATTAAKSAMGFTKGWEFDYALDVVTSTIAQDIAITAGNLKDIETITSNYTLDSDELYANLNAVADKIKVGGDIIPEAKAYSNPDYTLTQSDRVKSGGFGDLF